MDDSVIESSGSEVQPESYDVNGDSNAGLPRRPAWNRPSNGVVEAGSVMGGAVSWPPLSESTRPLSRSSSDSSKPFPDGSASSSQAPVISLPPQRQANTTNTHANSTSSNTTRPRSRNRGGGSGPSHNTFNRPSTPAPPAFSFLEAPYGVVPPMLGRRPVQGVGGSQSYMGNDHSSQRNNTSRRGNFGPRSRGNAPYHNNHGGRRNQDRRDVHLPSQYMPPPIGYMPSPLPPGAAPFMAPPVFPGQIGFDIAAPYVYLPTIPPEPFGAMPVVPPPPPPPPMLFPPANGITLANMIVNQIDYYFSDDNLVKDDFLRSKMDDHGWVPISLIASFRRVQQLTKDVSVVLESLRYSTTVEVQGDKVRRRNEWNKWLLSSSRLNNDPAPQTPGDILATSLQRVSMGDSMTNANGNTVIERSQTDMATGMPLSEESTGQSRLVNGEDNSEETQ